LKQLIKILGVFYIIFIGNLKCYAQDPVHFKIGETEFANTHIYTLLYDDNTDIIYAGTNNGVYAYKQNKFVRIQNAKQQKGNDIFSLIQNKKGEIFCTNLFSQIFKIQNDALCLYYQSNEKSNYTWCHIADEKKLIFANRLNIKKINNDGTDEILYKILKDECITSSNITSEGIYFFISNQITGTNKIIKYTNQNLQISVITTLSKREDIANFITQNGKTFAIKNNGDLFNLKDSLIQQFEPNKKERFFQINSNLAIGLDTHKGARYYYSTQDSITTSAFFFNKTFLSAFTKSKNETLLFGTFGEGIIVIPNYKISKFTKNQLFLDLVATPKNKVAISTRSGEIFTYQNNTLHLIDKAPNNVDHIFYAPNFKFNKKNDFIYDDYKNYYLGIKDAIVINDRKMIYATFNGVYLFNNKNRNIFDKTISTERCNALAWSKKDSTIYFTTNEGLFKKKLTGTNTSSLLSKKKRILANDLSFTNELLICGSTNNGVIIFKNDVQYFQLTKKNGLLSNTVKQTILKDDILYILTTKGLQIYNLKLNKFINLGTNDGIITNNITKFSLSNDRLWLLEKHSLSSVAIKSIVKPKNKNQMGELYIDSLLINRKNIDHNKQHTFNYTNNKLTVYFDYRNIETKTDTKIEYTLKGYYNTWKTIPTTQNKIEIHVLPPGKYNLKIRATYRNQKTKTFTYKFKITPPFWKTWWFYTLIRATILLYLYYIFKQLKRKNVMLLEKQILKNSLLDSELKALRSQMNPHFIFNSLNAIQGLILQQDTDASYDYIVLFANLVRNTLNYSNKDFIPIHKELDFLEVYLKLEKLRFGDEFTYSINYTGDKEIQVPSLIVQPFIENALLHGLLHKKGEKKLSITFEFDKQLKCTIIDNGIGRKNAQKIKKRQGNTYQSFALDAIEKRLQILSQQNNTKTHFTTTDLYDCDIAKGTKIVILMPFKKVF